MPQSVGQNNWLIASIDLQSKRGVPREDIEREARLYKGDLPLIWRFLQIHVLHTIAGHPNVIELHEVFETPNE